MFISLNFVMYKIITYFYSIMLKCIIKIIPNVDVKLRQITDTRILPVGISPVASVAYMGKMRSGHNFSSKP